METQYVAGGGVSIWCDAERHPLVPHDPPGDPSGPFSAEPECAAGDAHNELREALGQNRVAHGYGGAAFQYFASEQQRPLVVSTVDQMHGGNNGYLNLFVSHPTTGDRHGSEGCGPQMIVLPLHPHWGWPDPETYTAFAWVHIPVLGVTDDLMVCGSSVGIVTGVIS